MPSQFPNLDQAAVIDAVHESLLILAPMGTGKTRTAAAAIRKALESGIEPNRILGLTFTNRAAEAMRAAVVEAFPASAGKEPLRVPLFNLHGLCVRLLREEGRLVDLPPDFGILDEDESADLLWQFIPRVDREGHYHGKPMEALNAYEKFVFNFLMHGKANPLPPPFRMYRDAMHREGSVDFTGLIARTWHILKTNSQVCQRWQTRYQWILVDEVQDINLAEYQIIARSAETHRCAKFFGDTHQTIYEWRFAQPRQVIEAFERDFQPKRVTLRTNYRCSKTLVEITNTVRKTFIPSQEPLPEAAGKHANGQITLKTFDTSTAEIDAVISQVTAWRQDGISCNQIAVLTRQNRTLVEISGALKTAKIPHLIAEDFDFFRRKEVKDVVAILEHLVTPFRRRPILRLLKHFGVKVGALDALEKSIQGTGLHLGYLVRGARGDPLYPLIDAWDNKHLVALDTETTGLDPSTTEVIQFAKVPMASTTHSEKPYCEWIRPTCSVEESVHTHGFTDEFLATHGKEAREVFEHGLRFETGQVLLGHNLAFDLRILRQHATRVGLTPTFPIFFDTMPLAASSISKERLSGLRLETIANTLGITLPKTHHAEADARACLSILEYLMPTLKETQPIRLKIIADMGSELGLAFRKVTDILQQAAEKEAAETSLSHLILAIWKILRETPGHHDYSTNPNRTRNIEELAGVAQFIEQRWGESISLFLFLEQVALSRRDMMLEVDPDRVRLLSAHAAKGLEFEAVALPRLIKPWPGYSEEEARIFYVMLTRARRHLWLSWPKTRKLPWGKEQSTERLKYLSVLETYFSQS